MQKTLTIGKPKSELDPSGYFALIYEPNGDGYGPLQAWLEIKMPDTYQADEIRQVRQVVKRLDSALRGIERERRKK